MNRPLALIEGALAIPKPRPFDGLPPPFGSRRRTARAAAQDATQRAPQPIAQTEAQQAMQDAVQRRPQQARPGPFPPGAKLLFYKVPQQRVDFHRFDVAMAEAKRYLEAGRARPRSSRSDHILGGAIFVGCGIALAWLLATCAMRDANKASELAVKPPVMSAVSSSPVVDSQESIKLAQLAVEETQTTVLSVPSVGKLTVADTQSAAVAERALPPDIAVAANVAAKPAGAEAPLAASASQVKQSARVSTVVPEQVAQTLSKPPAAPQQLAQVGPLFSTGPKGATQVLPRQTVQVIVGDDEVATPPTKPAKRVNMARLPKAHVNERVALNGATRPTTQAAMSKQPEWTADASRWRNDVSIDDAPRLNRPTHQHLRPASTMRALVPVPGDSNWNDHMTQRRITDDPAAFHTGGIRQ
ncbi:hypothetical protein PQQ87_22890 [Paraburkholderia nemoris]|uniref:hypothetical protein n=1 Tax=Paraburkholderia nemoris TaxID=2793076 RepID=UPI0038B9EC13